MGVILVAALASGVALARSAAGQKPVPRAAAAVAGVAARNAARAVSSYWLVSSSGQIFAFGNAKNYGSMAGKRFRGSIAGVASTPDGRGYWIVTSRKQVFGFGDAHRYRYRRATKLPRYVGSPRPRGIRHLKGRIVGMAVALLQTSVRTTTTNPGGTIVPDGAPQTGPGTTPSTTTATTSTTTATTTTTTTTVTTRAPAPLAIATSSLTDASQYSSYDAQLTATGGTSPYTWTTSSSLPPGISLSSAGLLQGIPTSQGTSSLTVTVTDSTGATATTTLSLTVGVQGSALNWSGYAEQSLDGAPFTSASGTFTVPGLDSSDTVRQALSEWVGIDGYDDPDLIQAGIGQDVSSVTGKPEAYAWWEILPNFETEISSLTVSPGDTVTVSLDAISPTQQCSTENGDGQTVTGEQWEISVQDDTTDKSFWTEQCYGGAEDSAEWIVEAPQETFLHNGQQIACYTGVDAFSPEVQFSGVTSSVSDPSLDYIQMLQSRAAGINANPTGCPYMISQAVTPSLMSPAGFNVAYGATMPAAP